MKKTVRKENIQRFAVVVATRHKGQKVLLVLMVQTVQMVFRGHQEKMGLTLHHV